MTGDCDNCGHSIAYHVPILGCMKCRCSEYKRGPRTARRILLCLALAAVLLPACHAPRFHVGCSCAPWGHR